MGIDMSANIVFGCSISVDELDKFVVQTEEKFHYEKEYNKKGEQIKVKVIDEKAKKFYSHNGNNFQYQEDFIDYISTQLNYEYSPIESYESDDYVLSLKLLSSNFVIRKGFDLGRFDVGESYNYNSIFDLKDDLDKLKSSIENFGISCSEPGIFLVASLSY
jgi:hypothetical protein